jgi:hypothetical protein
LAKGRTLLEEPEAMMTRWLQEMDNADSIVPVAL